MPAESCGRAPPSHSIRISIIILLESCTISGLAAATLQPLSVGPSVGPSRSKVQACPFTTIGDSVKVIHVIAVDFQGAGAGGGEL